MVELPDKTELESPPYSRPDPLEDVQMLERLYAELSARIYCTDNEKEKLRLRTLQTEIEGVLEYK